MKKICPKCGKDSYKFGVYLYVTAPLKFYANLSKKNMRSKEFQIDAALWETTNWFCTNSKCLYNVDAFAQIRLDYNTKKGVR